MRGFEYNGDFPNKSELEKQAVLCKLNGDSLGYHVRVDTACNDAAKTTLLVAETELSAHHIEHLDIAGGQVVLKFDGAFYTFHASDPCTKRLVFWPLAVAVADVHEGKEHIEKFENEGGLVHPKADEIVTGTVVQPRYPVSGPSVTAVKETRVRPNPNEDGGVNWPIGGDRPEVAGAQC